AYDRLDGLAGEALLDVAYQRVKLGLELAGSALAFAGAHATSYAERPAAFARLLASTPRLAARLPPHFERELERAARAKLDPSGEPLLPHGDAGAQRAWLKRRIVDGVPALSAFLVWELEELTGRHAPLNALLARWTAMPSRSQRLREWVKHALHPNRPFLDDVLPDRRWLTTILGYSSGAIPTLLTGRTPSQHGHWNLFYYDPQRSPFRWTRALAPLPSPLVENRVARRVLKSAARRL